LEAELFVDRPDRVIERIVPRSEISKPVTPGVLHRPPFERGGDPPSPKVRVSTRQPYPKRLWTASVSEQAGHPDIVVAVRCEEEPVEDRLGVLEVNRDELLEGDRTILAHAGHICGSQRLQSVEALTDVWVAGPLLGKGRESDSLILQSGRSIRYPREVGSREVQAGFPRLPSDHEPVALQKVYSPRVILPGPAPEAGRVPGEGLPLEDRVHLGRDPTSPVRGGDRDHQPEFLRVVSEHRMFERPKGDDVPRRALLHDEPMTDATGLGRQDVVPVAALLRGLGEIGFALPADTGGRIVVRVREGPEGVAFGVHESRRGGSILASHRLDVPPRGSSFERVLATLASNRLTASNGSGDRPRGSGVLPRRFRRTGSKGHCVQLPYRLIGT